MRILLVEDDPLLGKGLASVLRQEGYEPDWVGTRREGEVNIRTQAYAATLLDLGLPDGSGLDLLAWMRRNGHRTPTLVLTARDSVEDRVRGLDGGADDYLPKPFAVSELLSRLRALIRRSAGFADNAWTVGAVTLEPELRRVSLHGGELALPPKEYRVLLELMTRAGRIVPREVLEEALAGDGGALDSNALEVHVHHLRRKLGAGFIQTLRGVGYRVRG